MLLEQALGLMATDAAMAAASFPFPLQLEMTYPFPGVATAVKSHFHSAFGLLQASVKVNHNGAFSLGSCMQALC